MGIFIKQFLLLFSVQLITAERRWIVEDISGRRYLVGYITGFNTRKYPYNLMPLNMKEIYYKTGRTKKKASVDKKAIAVRKNRVKHKCK